MNDSDLRRLMLPDDGMPKDRHDLVKERVMASVRTEEPTHEQPTGFRFRLRLAPALVSIVAVVLVAGTAVAVGLFPREAQEQLAESGCRDGTSVETLVATAQAVDGRTFDFWITSPGPEGIPNGVILLDDDKDSIGGIIGCSSPDASNLTGGAEMWVATPAEASIEGTLMSVMGHVPAPAVVAEVTFDDGTSIRANVQTDGYFLELVHGPGVDVSPGNPEPDFPDPVHITAIDSDGTVIADQDL